MYKYKATSKDQIRTANGNIEPDGYASIYVNNIGDGDMVVNSNIPVAPGGVWKFENRENVVIDEITKIRFVDPNAANKALILTVTYKPY